MALPVRKPLRLRDYDYAQGGVYFVTFCTAEKQCFLGSLHPVGAIHESPAVLLSDCGQIVEAAILSLPQRFPCLSVEKHIVMPNHVHLLLLLQGLEQRAIRESPLRRSVLSQCIGYLKMNSSREIRALLPLGQVWQRGYYDHVIRDEHDFQRIWRYLEENPARWAQDEYFTP